MFTEAVQTSTLVLALDFITTSLMPFTLSRDEVQIPKHRSHHWGLAAAFAIKQNVKDARLVHKHDFHVLGFEVESCRGIARLLNAECGSRGAIHTSLGIALSLRDGTGH